MSDFGPLVSLGVARRAVRDTLVTWQATYLAEAARRAGLAPDALPLVRSWVVAVSDEEIWNDEAALPVGIVVAPGLTEEPLRKGRGLYDVTAGVAVGVIVSARNREETLTLAEQYAMAFNAALVQHPSLGGVADSLDWLGMRLDDLTPNEAARTIQGVTLQYAVTLSNVVGSVGGPTVVPDDPHATPDPDPVITEARVSVEPRPL